MSSTTNRLEKTDGIEGVPSCREKLSAFLAQKQSGEEDPRLDQVYGVDQVSGFIQRESGPGQPHGLALLGIIVQPKPLGPGQTCLEQAQVSPH